MSSRAALAIAVCAPAAVAALLATVRGALDGTNAALALVLVVVGVAASGSRTAGVVAALSATAWFDFFLTEPYLTFTIAGRDDVETAVLLVLVGLAVTEIALWGRRQQAGSSLREGYLDGMVSTTAMVATGDDPGQVVAVAEQQLRGLLDVSGCSFRAGPPGPRPRIEPDGSVTLDGVALPVDRSGLPTNDVVELPVRCGGRVVGRFVLTASSRVARPDRERRRVAVALAEIVGAAVTGAERREATT